MLHVITITIVLYIFLRLTGALEAEPGVVRVDHGPPQKIENY
jgi:hypothetical protein